MKYAQFITILPPKEVLLEVLESELVRVLRERFGTEAIYASETLSIDGRAVRIHVVEKDTSEQ